jgi:hypothetical protein
MLNEIQPDQSNALEESADKGAGACADAAPIDRAAMLQRLRSQFNDQLIAMRGEAVGKDAAPVLADCCAFLLASLIVQYGADAAGDILEKVGAHVNSILAYQRAQREAEAAKEQGARPH